jgi:hypothetical protein
MSQQPYTNADLRAEAASCLSALGTLPTAADIRRSLPDAYIDSHRTPDSGREATWAAVVGEDGLGVPVDEIHALIEGAADVSKWAIQLGAAGLTPHPAMGWYCTTSGWDAAVQIATHPDLRPDLAAEIQTAVRAAVDNVMASTGCTVTHASSTKTHIEEPTR